jgi:peptide/nickel transport system substrate-binding protein/oligopeptide transport system substrate-binding protein
MLGIWKTGGRHPWSNAEYDALVDEAAGFLGDEAERTAMFQNASASLSKTSRQCSLNFVTRSS